MQHTYGNGKLIKTTLTNTNEYITDQEKIEFPDQKRIYDMLYSKYIHELSAKAQSVLMFILGRTFTFNKVKEAIKIDDIEHGVFSKGEIITAGTGLSRRTIERALKELTDYGIITNQRRMYRGSYTWSIFGINIQFFNEKIMESRKEKKEMAKKKTTPAERLAEKKKLNEQLPEEYKIKEQLKEDEDRGFYPPSGLTHPPVTSDVTITTNKLELYNHSKENISNFSNCRDLPNFKKLYQSKFKEYFPGKFIPFTQQQHGQLKHYFSKLVEIDDLDVSEFLDYCFAEWNYIVKNKLAFLEKHSESDLPNSAEINILLKFLNKFLEGFREQEDEFTPKYGDELQFRIKQLTKQGYSVDLATKTAVYEMEYRKDKKDSLESKIEQNEIKHEEQNAKIAMAYQQELDKLRKEKEELELKLKKEKNKDVLGFNMNNISIDDVESDLD